MNIDYSLETIESVRALEKTAKKLGVSEGDSLLLIRAKLFLRNGKQIHYKKSYLRGDKYKKHIIVV